MLINESFILKRLFEYKEYQENDLVQCIDLVIKYGTYTRVLTKCQEFQFPV